MTLVRHGQSEANLVQRWQGQGDSPLSALGKEQARRVGARLAQRRFTHVVSSDLQRASDTALATGLAYTRDPALREFDVGSWEGLTREEVEAQYPEEMERLKAGEDVPLGGGESYGTFSQRIDAALARLRTQLAPGDHALVVCHGGVIATTLSGLLGLRNRRWSFARVANTSITELSFSANGTVLDVFNDTLHLTELGAWPGHADAGCMVGLVCDGAPGAGLGSFAAHYDVAPQLLALGPSPKRDAYASVLSARLSELHALHPEERVSLTAHRASIHAWAEDALFRGSAHGEDVREQASTPIAAALGLPAVGSISHVGRWGDRLLLLDYALAPASVVG